ncbi:MAG: hypothetical protein NUW01_00095 [Gemmatimonadaceae bacterium]|nr:hypothetical protein [Gemmatimonadaceae bacterium]
MSDRQFPVLGSRGQTIPWWIAEECFKVYGGSSGHRYDQDLERVAERGGFGWHEIVALLRGEEAWRDLGRKAMSATHEEAR